MILREIISYLESRAQPSLQEHYDNSGLIIGSPDMEISSAMLCLDSTPEVIEDARKQGCNLIIAHHPIIFDGLKKINGKNYIERAVILAIRYDIAIYAIHTNLDNVHTGVNRKIAEKLGLEKVHVLKPKGGVLFKIAVYVPESNAEVVREAMFKAGAGKIGNYDECSFVIHGHGTFRAGDGATPYVGTPNERYHEREAKIEMIVPAWYITSVTSALKDAHPYEEVAYDIFHMHNEWNSTGAGMIGELPQPMKPVDFLLFVKETMKTSCIRHTGLLTGMVQRIALCGGSGSSLLDAALCQHADVFITADFKYHQFFDANGQIVIADIGHYESEQYTMELLSEWLGQKFPTFATHFTGVHTNPVYYL